MADHLRLPAQAFGRLEGGSADSSRPKSNYESALAAARARLAEIDVPARAALLGGEAFGEGGAATGVRLPFLGSYYLISIPDGAVSRLDGADVPVSHGILILHALLYHEGRLPAGDWIAFSDIPDGLLYTAVYERRTSVRLARALSGGRDVLAIAAERLGGRGAALGGDSSAVVEPFVGVPVGIVYWRGDDEFAAAATFLYDRTITEIFPTEDIVVLTQCLTERIIHIQRETTP